MPIEFEDTIRFERVKEDRGGYFVEYSVPNEGVWFATLCLVFHQPAMSEDVAKAMESELEPWVRRYSVPVMVTAFDDTEHVIPIAPHRPDDHVIGWLDSNGELVTHWKAETPPGAPSLKFTKGVLRATYRDIPFAVSTAADKRRSLNLTIARNRILLGLVILWLVVIPVTIALLGQTNPIVGWATTIFSVLQGLWKLAELLGWKKQSKREEEKDAEELRMKHHHYYCERNPEGFNRLKVDVLNQELREQIQKEADELKRKK